MRLSQLRRRLAFLKASAASKSVALRQDVPASVQWLSVLRFSLPILQRCERTPETEAGIARIRRSITLLEEYIAGDLQMNPWAYLEYYLGACVMRLSWKGDWVGREFAFMEPDYDEHMTEIEKIERPRRAVVCEVHR